MAERRLRFTILSTELSGQQVELGTDDPIFVGRTSDNALVLEHKSVSRRHARIEAVDDGSITVTDLDSHNGTRVGSQPVDGKTAIEPGDIITFGEVRVQMALSEAGQDPASAPPTVAALPAVIDDAMLPAAPGERPLSFDDVFAIAPKAEAPPPARDRKAAHSLLFSLSLIALIVVGLYVYWRVGVAPWEPPVIGVQVRVNEVKPVNLAKYLRRVDAIGDPDPEKIAQARETKFPFIVTVHGRAIGDTDIAVDGPPAGRVILRVLVNDVLPRSKFLRDLDTMPPSERRRLAAQYVHRASNRTSPQVDAQTGKAIQEFERAARIYNSMLEIGLANEADRRARQLRKRRERRYDELTKIIDNARREGRYEDASKAAEEILRIFPDPDSVERAVAKFILRIIDQEAEQYHREQEDR